MPQNHREQPYRGAARQDRDYQHRDDQDRDYERRASMRRGEDRDPYESGDERRYLSDWEARSRRRGFEGDRRWPTSGYPEEVGYREGRRGVFSERASDWLPESGGRSPGSGGDYRQSWIGREPEGSFRGRGPKGYERSDARMKEMICERLTDDPRIDASEVSIEVNQKVVKLSGTVDDRRTKHEIEDLVENLGATDIDNQLRVKRRS